MNLFILYLIVYLLLVLDLVLYMWIIFKYLTHLPSPRFFYLQKKFLVFFKTQLIAQSRAEQRQSVSSPLFRRSVSSFIEQHYLRRIIITLTFRTHIDVWLKFCTTFTRRQPSQSQTTAKWRATRNQMGKNRLVFILF